MFLYEKDLKKAFWDHYKDRKSVLKYQFECAAREGGVDLLTIEEYGGEYEICSFEFKLDNMKKLSPKRRRTFRLCRRALLSYQRIRKI